MTSEAGGSEHSCSEYLVERILNSLMGILSTGKEWALSKPSLCGVSCVCNVISSDGCSCAISSLVFWYNSEDL